MFLFEVLLTNFLHTFPAFTDHTLLHSLNVINITNNILRSEVEKLNAEEIYVYLMATALHDVGMGVNDKDLEQFIDAIGQREFVNTHSDLPKATIIRMLHNELALEFIKKYCNLLELPNEKYAYAIGQVSRGHRKVDLFNEDEYPVDFDLGDGKRVNLAALSAIIRIADELDIASDRNIELIYDVSQVSEATEINIFEFSKHKAIEPIVFEDDYILVKAVTDDENVAEGIIQTVNTVKKTLDYSASVLRERGDIRLYTENIRLVLNGIVHDMTSK